MLPSKELKLGWSNRKAYNLTAPYTKKQQLKHNKKPKRKRCKECNKLFPKEGNELKPCCSSYCMSIYISKPENLKKHIEHGKKLREKENQQKKKEFRINEKTGLKEAVQKVVNKYIRLRDMYKPCISCGAIEAIQWDAGHFRPVGNNQQVRYYTLNIHKQCSHCNDQLSANLVPYKENLIKKIGLEKFEKLEADHSTKKYSVEYLERLRKVFNKKIKLYERKFR